MMNKQTDENKSPAQKPQRPPSRGLIWSGYAFLIWSAAYGFLHFLWAFDIGISMLKPSAVELSVFKVANVVTAVVLTAIGFLGPMFIYFRRQKYLGWLLLTVSLLGCSLATSHGIYGVIYRILQITGVIELVPGPFNPSEHAYLLWDLFLFEPWFLVEGILLAIMGWCYLDETRSKRIWLLLCIVGTVVGLITGILGVRVE